MDDRLTDLLILCAACAALLIASLALLIRLLVRRAQAQRSQREELAALRQAMDGALSSLRQELSATVQSSVSSLGNLLGDAQIVHILADSFHLPHPPQSRSGIGFPLASSTW